VKDVSGPQRWAVGAQVLPVLCMGMAPAASGEMGRVAAASKMRADIVEYTMWLGWTSLSGGHRVLSLVPRLVGASTACPEVT